MSHGYATKLQEMEKERQEQAFANRNPEYVNPVSNIQPVYGSTYG